MRSIVCRFKDEADFRHHLRTGFSRRGRAITLVTDVDLEPGETLQFHCIVSQVREDLKVTGTVFEKTPVGLDDGRGPTHRYVCVVDPNDKVWIEMFLQKISMLSELSAAA